MFFIYWLPHIRILILIRCILVTKSSCNCSVKNYLTIQMTSVFPMACWGWEGTSAFLMARCLHLVPLLCSVPVQAPWRAVLPPGVGNLGGRASGHSAGLCETAPLGAVSAFLGLQSLSLYMFVLSKQMHGSKQSQISNRSGELQPHLQDWELGYTAQSDTLCVMWVYFCHN